VEQWLRRAGHLAQTWVDTTQRHHASTTAREEDRHPICQREEIQMTEKKEVSQLARQILGTSGAVTFFTQQEFDDAMTIAKAEIMTVAIETSKKVILIERQACADLVLALAAEEDEGEVATALKNAAEAILNRIPSQRQ
jgi:hypothetical protein